MGRQAREETPEESELLRGFSLRTLQLCGDLMQNHEIAPTRNCFVADPSWRGASESIRLVRGSPVRSVGGNVGGIPFSVGALVLGGLQQSYLELNLKNTLSVFVDID